MAGTTVLCTQYPARVTILLAVAARKQNERSLTTAAEKLEQHIEQIGSSNERIMKGESDMLVRMTQRMNKNFDEIREEHNTRMKNVMTDIRALNDSMVASAEHSTNSSEMQRLWVQVERYDQVIPVYQVQIKDVQDRNKKLWADLVGERGYMGQLKVRLDKAKALVISLGTVNLLWMMMRVKMAMRTKILTNRNSSPLPPLPRMKVVKQRLDRARIRSWKLPLA